MTAPRLLPPLLLALAAPAHAMQPLSTREQLCERAGLVVIAEVTTVETLWSQEGAIERRAWASVSRVIRGANAAPPDTVEILLPGGRIGDLRLDVEDVPDLVEDVRYLLFLSRGPGGDLQVIGGEGGAVLIQATRNGPGESHLEAVASVAACHAQ